MIKVSIVIPVHNAQAYLSACIESLLNQTFQEYELVFVNDGSTDNSGEILKQFRDKDKRIQIIEQENKGVSNARNEGIKRAAGEYIGFVDSDDTIKEDMIETLYKNAIANSVDIVLSYLILERDKKYIVKKHSFEVNKCYDPMFIEQNIIPNFLKCQDLFSTCTNLYRRNFLERNHILFPEKVVLEEDAKFNIRAFLKAEKILFIDYAGYYYRDNKKSTSRRTSYEMMFDQAKEKYDFGYKEYFNLNMEESQILELKSFRFFDKVCYIIFLVATQKKYSLKKSVIFSKSLLLNSGTKKAVQILALRNNDFSRFHKMIYHIAQTKSFWKLSFLIGILRSFYYPRISEIFRKFN